MEAATHTEHIPGQLIMLGGQLRTPSAQERSFRLCCREALVDDSRYCVCAFVTTCPTHGVRHNGTHD